MDGDVDICSRSPRCRRGPPGASARQRSEPEASPPARPGSLALASLAIAFGLVLIGFGLVRSVTGDDVTNLPVA